MSNCRQSVRPFPCANQPYLLGYNTYTYTPTKLKIQATQLIKGHIGSFKTILDSFQDPCLNHHIFNIFNSIWCISHQNKCHLLNFKFLNLCAPAGPLWLPMSEFGWVSKTHKKHGNFHNTGSNLLKLTPEVTTIGAHFVSKFQPYTPILAKLLQKVYPVTPFKTIWPQFRSKLAIQHILSGKAPLYMFGPYLKFLSRHLSQIQHQNRLFSNSFQDPCFSLFAAQWLQDS